MNKKNIAVPRDTKRLNDLIRFICENSQDGEEWCEIQCQSIADDNKEIIIRNDLEGVYFVSNRGRILSLYHEDEPKQLKQFLHKGKYYRIDIDKRTIFVHRIVAEYFVGDIKGKEIHHKNRNTLDNRAQNLEILSKKEHAEKHTKKEDIKNAKCSKLENDKNKQSGQR